MAEPQTRENLAQNPLSRSPFAAAAADADLDTGDRPPAPPAVTADSDVVGIGDPDLIREPKRRKHCPMALENLDELTSASNSSFGFTFDTKFCGFAAEVTPKFGSFNSIAPEIEKKTKIEQSSVLDSASEVRGDEEDKEEAVHQEEEVEIEVGDALREAIGEAGGGLESVAH